MSERNWQQLLEVLQRSQPEDLPHNLLRLKELAGNLPEGSLLLREFKTDLWTCGVFSLSCRLLRQQLLSKDPEEWHGVADVAAFLVNCAINFKPEDAPGAWKAILANILESLLTALRHCQIESLQTKTDLSRTAYLAPMQKLISAIKTFLRCHTQLCSSVLTSLWFIQFFICDSVLTGGIALELIDFIIHTEPTSFKRLDFAEQYVLLDEIIFKLANSKDPSLAGSALRTLMLLIERDSGVATLLHSRYKGLRALISARWTGSYFGNDLRRFLQLLRRADPSRVADDEFHTAAVTIQKTIRGYLSRRRMRKANEKLAHFQSSYRTKLTTQRNAAESRQRDEELQYQLQLTRRRAVRDCQQRLMEKLLSADDAEAENILERERSNAVMKIQALYKGYLTRKDFVPLKEKVKKDKAATLIQNWFRNLFYRHGLKNKSPDWYELPGLDDNKRVELQERINRAKLARNRPPPTPEEVAATHEKAQVALEKYYRTLPTDRALLHNVQSAQAHIEADFALFDSAMPRQLEDADSDLARRFYVGNLPIQVRARMDLDAELSNTNQSWWKKLKNPGDDADELKLRNLVANDKKIINYISNWDPSDPS